MFMLYVTTECYVFLEAVVQGEEDLVKCANKAYDASPTFFKMIVLQGLEQGKTSSALVSIESGTIRLIVHHHNYTPVLPPFEVIK